MIRTLVAVFVLSTTSAVAQSTTDIIPSADSSAAHIEALRAFPHAISAQVYAAKFGEAQLGTAVEIGYHQSLTDQFSIGVPIRFGVYEQGGEPPLRTSYASLDAVASYSFRLAQGKLKPFVFGGAGLQVARGSGAVPQVPVGAGFRFQLKDATYLTTQVEYRKSLGDLADNLQAGIGLYFDLSQASFDGRYWDTDEDGVADAKDDCPQVPGSRRLNGCPDSDGDGFSDATDPCPLYYGTKSDGGCPDKDKDGVPDPVDACPTVFGLAIRDGCPAPDADGDGFADAEDNCPTVAGTLKGCPDGDADGIADAADLCPTEAGPKTTKGCPDRDNDRVADKDDPCPLQAGLLRGCPDRDEDGVADADDRCPNVAGDAATDGCPELMSEVRGGIRNAVPDVRFSESETALSEAAREKLDNLAKLLLEYPRYSLHVTGHADFDEPVPDRTVLSARRAQVCADYVAAQGVDASRIKVDGYGAGKPIVREGSAKERQSNLRVEFDLLKD